MNKEKTITVSIPQGKRAEWVNDSFGFECIKETIRPFIGLRDEKDKKVYKIENLTFFTILVAAK